MGVEDKRLVDAFHRLATNVMEMHLDNVKGDFPLNELARLDLDACVEVIKEYDYE